jgi:medium-chain acyl-[acyl-carrier-protein] hydrolase
VARLRTLKATPAEILENEELMQLFEPMLRADFALSETHEFNPGVRIESPTTLFWGEGDDEVPREDMLAWSEHVAGTVDLVPFDGDHFFIHSHRNGVVGKVRAIVEGAVG